MWSAWLWQTLIQGHSAPNVLLSLITLDSAWVACQFLVRKTIDAFKGEDQSEDARHILVKTYGDVYTVRQWTTRYIHYIIIFLLTLPPYFLVSETSYDTLVKTLVLLHTPIVLNLLVDQSRTIGSYFYYLKRVQDQFVRFWVLMTLSHIIKPHIDDPRLKQNISALKMFDDVDQTRVNLMLKNLLVVTLLGYCRSYANLYIYYKIAKYVYYYNYGYKYEVMQPEDAKRHLSHIVRNSVWSALSEPIFVHSIITLEGARNVTKYRWDSAILFVCQWSSFWTLGTLFNSQPFILLLYLSSHTLNVGTILTAMTSMVIHQTLKSWPLTGAYLAVGHVIFRSQTIDLLRQFVVLQSNLQVTEPFVRIPSHDDITQGFVIVPS